MSSSVQTYWANPQSAMSDLQFKKLCKQLTLCQPLFMSFLPGCENKDISYCPFAKTMKGWRDRYLTEPSFDEQKCCKCTAKNRKGIYNHLQSKAQTCPYHRAAFCYMNSYLGNSGIHHQVIYNGKNDHFGAIKSAKSDQTVRFTNIIKMMQENKHNFDVIKTNALVVVEGGLNEEGTRQEYRKIYHKLKRDSTVVNGQPIGVIDKQERKPVKMVPGW